MENGASLMMKNKCEVLPDEDWGFDKTTTKLVIGFQGLQFQTDEDDVGSGVTLKLYNNVINIIKITLIG